MIEDFKNGVRKITLGEGSTYISQILIDGDEISSGICFSNKYSANDKYSFNGDEVIIEITNFQGAMSYLKAGIELLKSWKIEGLDSLYDEVLKDIDKIIKK